VAQHWTKQPAEGTPGSESELREFFDARVQERRSAAIDLAAGLIGKVDAGRPADRASCTRFGLP